MDTNPAKSIHGKYKTNGANYFAKFEEEKGGLDFETLAKNNELYFADKGPSFYVNTNESFSAEIFDKYDKRQDGNLEIGDPAPNCKVQLLPMAKNKLDNDRDEKLEYEYIFDFCSNSDNSKPMVLNFGSFSWAPFAALHAKETNQLYQEFHDDVDFLTIYISEAHPCDEWSMFSYVDVDQHKTMQDRMNAAYKYQQLANTKMTIVLDMIDDKDNAETLYASWPDRFYIIQNKKIVFKGELGPNGYKPDKVEEWINQYLLSKSITQFDKNVKNEAIKSSF